MPQRSGLEGQGRPRGGQRQGRQARVGKHVSLSLSGVGGPPGTLHGNPFRPQPHWALLPRVRKCNLRRNSQETATPVAGCSAEFLPFGAFSVSTGRLLFFYWSVFSFHPTAMFSCPRRRFQMANIVVLFICVKTHRALPSTAVPCS